MPRKIPSPLSPLPQSREDTLKVAEKILKRVRRDIAAALREIEQWKLMLLKTDK